MARQCRTAGVLHALSGGTALNDTVLSGGLQLVDDQGKTTGTVVSSGGVEYVALGGVASGTVLSGGGVDQIYGSAVLGTVLSGATD